MHFATANCLPNSLLQMIGSRFAEAAITVDDQDLILKRVFKISFSYGMR